MPNIPKLGTPSSQAFMAAEGVGMKDPFSAFGDTAFDSAMNIFRLQRQRERDRLRQENINREFGLKEQDIASRAEERSYQRDLREREFERRKEYDKVLAEEKKQRLDLNKMVQEGKIRAQEERARREELGRKREEAALGYLSSIETDDPKEYRKKVLELIKKRPSIGAELKSAFGKFKPSAARTTTAGKDSGNIAKLKAEYYSAKKALDSMSPTDLELDPAIKSRLMQKMIKAEEMLRYMSPEALQEGTDTAQPTPLLPQQGPQLGPMVNQERPDLVGPQFPEMDPAESLRKQIRDIISGAGDVIGPNSERMLMTNDINQLQDILNQAKSRYGI